MAEAEEGARRGGESENAAGAIFVPYMMMEDLLDKLKLLDYEAQFCAPNALRPFGRLHFALPGDSSKQFFHFALLVTWQLSMLGRQMEQVQEYDDPNATVSTLITTLKSAGVPVNFPPAKLKQGYGEHVLQVLDTLAETVLKAKNWKWGVPRHNADAGGAEAEADDLEEEMEDETAEVKTGRGSEFDEIVDETAAATGSDDDDDDEAVGLTGMKNTLLQEAAAMPQHREALVSKASGQEWRLEVERVLPALRVQIRADGKDWRVRSQHIGKNQAAIEAQLADAKLQLTRIHDDVNKALEKIGSREKYINAQLTGPLEEYRKLSNSSTETSTRYNGSSSGVNELTRTLAQMSDELDSLKFEMDEYGASMSDAAPLVRLKQGVTRLKADTVDAQMRSGVLGHVLVATAMMQKNALQRDLNIDRPTLTSNNYGEFNTV